MSFTSYKKTKNKKEIMKTFSPITSQLKDKTVMIIDDGYQVELAVLFSKLFKKVYYFCEWRSNGYPKVEDWSVGQNIPGVESVDCIFDYVNETDLFVFTHILQSDLQVFLEKMGKQVYGARRAEILEIDRSYLKDLLINLGLPVADYDIVYGTEELHKILEHQQNNWIKIDAKFRGFFETTHNSRYELTETWIDMIEHQLGAMGDTFEFMVEKDIPGGREIGGEYVCVNGLWQNRNLFGIEIKNKGYIGRILPREKAPKVLTNITDKLSPIFREFGYKGNYHDEVRVTKDGKGYLIDATCRFGCPPGYLMQLMYKNYTEMIYRASLGMVTEPEYEHEFGVELIIDCPTNLTNYSPVYIPQEYRQNVKLNHYMLKGDVPFVCPNGFIGSVVTEADTLDEAIEECEEIVNKIEGMDFVYDIYSLKRAVEEIDLLDSLDINFFEA